MDDWHFPTIPMHYVTINDGAVEDLLVWASGDKPGRILFWREQGRKDVRKSHQPNDST